MRYGTGAYQIRRSGGNPKYPVFVTTLPRAIGEALEGRYFKAELTNEGIFLRPVPAPKEKPQAAIELPEWARKDPE